MPIRAGRAGPDTEAIEVKENQTKPPPRFTEATLLSAMEGAGKLVDDEELREAMSERGLGTPATRAQIIEGLLSEGYISRQGKELVVTAKGLSLITLLRDLHADALTKPELTGEWESRSAKWSAASFRAKPSWATSAISRGRSWRRSAAAWARSPRQIRAARRLHARGAVSRIQGNLPRVRVPRLQADCLEDHGRARI